MDAPWSNNKTLSIEDTKKRLSKEILDFQKYIGPTKTEELNRDTLLYTVVQVLETNFPGASFMPYGSYATGLQFPSSDIDVCIDYGYELGKKHISQMLFNLRRTLSRQGLFKWEDMTIIPFARIPVLTITNEKNISLDITIQGQSYSSNRTSVWLRQYPELKPLFYVLKQALKGTRLWSDPKFDPTSSKDNGLASYSLICMIVSFLQMHTKDSDKSKPDYYAYLLLGFLDFYSGFDETEQVISLSDGGKYYTYDNTPSTYRPKSRTLNIIDPDIPEMNVARSTSKFAQIKEILRNMSLSLHDRVRSATSNSSILSSVICVKPHRYDQPRDEGSQFSAELIFVGSQSDKPKVSRNKSARALRQAIEPYHINKRNQNTGSQYKKRNDQGYVDDDFEQASYRSRYDNDRYQEESHRSTRGQRYENEENSKEMSRKERRRMGYQQEYERHKANNRSHLAQHYKQKANSRR